MGHPWTHALIMKDAQDRAWGSGTIDVAHFLGQSNCDGEAPRPDLIAGANAALAADEARLACWYKITGTKVVTTTTMDYLRTSVGAPFNNVHGPEVSLGRVLYARGYRVLYQHGKGGTSLYDDGTPGNHWKPGVAGSNYELWKANVPLLVTQIQTRFLGNVTIRHRCLFWLQGEEDAKYSNAEKPGVDPSGNYQTNLEALIAAARTDLATPNLPVVICGINPAITGRPYVATVIAKQQAVAAADPTRVFFTSSTGLGLQVDGVHDTSDAAVARGYAMGALAP